MDGCDRRADVCYAVSLSGDLSRKMMGSHDKPPDASRVSGKDDALSSGYLSLHAFDRMA
jgi:hypothetical protein